MPNRYRPVEARADFPAMERRILQAWRDGRVFERSVEQRRGGPEWVFFDGPPTANNRPHIGHVEARTFKDLYPRFKTMTGHFVARKAGWDCHGLPVEVEVEKAIGTRSKRDIEAFGVAEFVRLCRESVRRYVDDWRRMSERMGFWIDMDHPYWTMDPQYVQSVWWALKRLHETGLLYQDFRVAAYCPRCGTGLSDAELAMGYATLTDPSLYVRFRVVESPDPELAGVSMVGWTTTPWTLVSNLGLAVAPDQPYVRIHRGGEGFVVAERLRHTLGEGGEQIGPAFPGSRLVGMRYEPPYPNVDDPNVHRVVAASFVSMDEGTGVVHMAPAFGAEDLEVAKREGWPVFNPVDEEGRFTDRAPEFVRGMFVKDADQPIIDDLTARGLALRAERIEHTYPRCWRCETVLLYYARRAWYVRTTARKAELLQANEEVDWYPEHIKEGRYGDWLRNNVDWALSRERYWGTPLPVWVCPEGHTTVIESLEELSDLAGRDVTGVDPHRPAIDDVTFRCRSCGAEAHRVPEVIDAWFDSGAMPYAQWGYRGPDSDGAALFAERFPADFIAEGIDQTRGWFYSLMAEAVLLFGQNAYRNVICHGLVLDAEGRKMSKRLGNVIEPEEAFDRYGADAVRWYMVASGSPWADRRLSFELIEDVVRRVFLTLWNTYAFFVTYANLDQPNLAEAPPPADRPALDRWALSRLHDTVAAVRAALEGFDATGAARTLAAFVDDLSNWYVRRARRRFWDPARADGGGDVQASKLAAHATLEESLFVLTTLLAPFVPFVAEEIYGNLAAAHPEAPDSVHLCDFPGADPDLIDPELERAMDVARAVVSLGRQVRTDAKVRVRQPLSTAEIHVPGAEDRMEELVPLVAEELNVKAVRFVENADELSRSRLRPVFARLGPRLGATAQAVARRLLEDDGTVAAELAAGRTATVKVDGDEPVGVEVEVGPEDVEFVQQPRPGWGVATDGSVTVALDLDLERSPALRREGMVREVIHHLQALRKSAGLELTDRIDVAVQANSEDRLAYAVGTATSAIAAEVLARTLTVVGANQDPADQWDATEAVTVDGMRARLFLRKA